MVSDNLQNLNFYAKIGVWGRVLFSQTAFVLILVAIIPQMGWIINDRVLFLTVLEARKVKPADCLV